MKYVVWILQVLLALLMVGTGAAKLVTPRADLLARMGWVEDFSATQIHLIGVAEIVGGIGLIVPAATGIAPILTPLAASGVAALMLGAAYTHIRRGEPFVGTAVFTAMAIVIAVVWFRRLGGARPPARRSPSGT